MYELLKNANRVTLSRAVYNYICEFAFVFQNSCLQIHTVEWRRYVFVNYSHGDLRHSYLSHYRCVAYIYNNSRILADLGFHKYSS